MKLWWKKPNNIIAVTIWPTTISIHHFKKTSPRITLENIWSYKNSDFLLDNLQMHSISRVANMLKKHAQQLNAPIIIGLRGYQLQENMVASKTKQVTSDIFNFPSLHTHQSGYAYMYPHNDTEHMFYTWQVPHHILFSYQLAAHMSDQKLLDIVPYQSALFTAYTQYKHPIFRPLELARDMAANHHSIEHYFSKESIHRLVKINTIINHNEHPQLMHAAGLIFSLLEVT